MAVALLVQRPNFARSVINSMSCVLPSRTSGASARTCAGWSKTQHVGTCKAGGSGT